MLGLRLGLSYVKGTVSAAVGWLMATGTWNDSGAWMDSGQWNDGV